MVATLIPYTRVTLDQDLTEDRIIRESVPDSVQSLDRARDAPARFFGNDAGAAERYAAVDCSQRATAAIEGSKEGRSAAFASSLNYYLGQIWKSGKILFMTQCCRPFCSQEKA